MICPKCDGGELELLETDSRQEWYEETYACNKCNRTFVRRVEFKPQSSLVAKDKLTEEK